MNTAELRVAWGPACKLTHTRVVLYGGAPITVDYRTKEAFTALSQCLERHDYQADRLQTGAYNCRPITGGNAYSLHAFGIAVDINWSRNPYGPTLVTDMPKAMVDDILAIYTNNERQVFRWGGTYAGNKDAMHYEIVCSPADLATGIAAHEPPPVKPDPPRPVPVPEDPSMIASARNKDGRLEVFRVSVYKTVQHAWQPAPNKPLGGWVDMPGVEASRGLAAVEDVDGRIELFAYTDDYSVFQCWQTAPNGGWSSWVKVT